MLRKTAPKQLAGWCWSQSALFGGPSINRIEVNMKTRSSFFFYKSNHKSKMDAAEKERVSVKKLRLVEWREERREGDGVVEPPSLPGDRT